MITIDLDELRHVVGDVGVVDKCEPISQPTGNNEIHASFLLGDGRVYEQIKYYYNQGLWRYIYCLYAEGEVCGRT